MTGEKNMSIIQQAKKKAVNPDDFPIDVRLQYNHKEAPNSVTETQLDSFHFEVDDLLTEGLLEKQRKNASDDEGTIEARLNKRKSPFNIQHRNNEASTGDINKLEEKRLSGTTQESEKYEAASTTEKDLRWWEKKSPDGLKLASNKKKVVALTIDADYDDDDDDRNESLLDTIEEALTLDDSAQYSKMTSNFSIVEDSSDSTGRVITVSFPPHDFGEDERLITNIALQKIKQVHPELSETINTSDFSEPDYRAATVDLYIDASDMPATSTQTSTMSFDKNDFSEYEVQEGNVVSVADTRAKHVLSGDKVGSAMEIFSQDFDEYNLVKTNERLDGILNHSFFNPAERNKFMSKVRSFLNEKGVSLENI